MRIEMKKFGEVLISRPAGHEAYLAIQSTLKTLAEYSGVKIEM